MATLAAWPLVLLAVRATPAQTPPTGTVAGPGLERFDPLLSGLLEDRAFQILDATTSWPNGDLFANYP